MHHADSGQGGCCADHSRARRSRTTHDSTRTCQCAHDAGTAKRLDDSDSGDDAAGGTESGGCDGALGADGTHSTDQVTAGPAGAAPGGEVFAVVEDKVVVAASQAALGRGDRGVGVTTLAIGTDEHLAAGDEVLEGGSDNARGGLVLVGLAEEVDDCSVAAVDAVVAVELGPDDVEVVSAGHDASPSLGMPDRTVRGRTGGSAGPVGTAAGTV